ncbi:hypothetical protein ACTPOK_41980 [Streptomyces inhibens]|uniref:hypothetical protein n=1 Tax=Streptomyces inhibens TaxID=2293571 RepID=UPI00402AD98E
MLEWIRQAGQDAPKPIQGFAGFLRRDLDAVAAGLTLSWSSGVAVGVARFESAGVCNGEQQAQELVFIGIALALYKEALAEPLTACLLKNGESETEPDASFPSW